APAPARPHPRPARRPRRDHTGARSRADQHRGLRAASLLPGARRHPVDARLRRERGAPCGRPARGAGLRRRDRTGHGRRVLMLFELGAYRMWDNDPVQAWRFMRLWLPAVIRVLAPNAGYGVSRMPATGGAVLAANHLSAIDPPAIGVYSTRAIRYM